MLPRSAYLSSPRARETPAARKRGAGIRPRSTSTCPVSPSPSLASPRPGHRRVHARRVPSDVTAGARAVGAAEVAGAAVTEIGAVLGDRVHRPAGPGAATADAKAAEKGTARARGAATEASPGSPRRLPFARW